MSVSASDKHAPAVEARPCPPRAARVVGAADLGGVKVYLCALPDANLCEILRTPWRRVSPGSYAQDGKRCLVGVAEDCHPDLGFARMKADAVPAVVRAAAAKDFDALCARYGVAAVWAQVQELAQVILTLREGARGC
jgi:hypothetical protein